MRLSEEQPGGTADGPGRRLARRDSLSERIRLDRRRRPQHSAIAMKDRLGALADPRTRSIVSQGLEGLNRAFRDRDAAAAHDHMTGFMAAAEQAFFAVRKADIESGAAASSGAAA